MKQSNLEKLILIAGPELSPITPNALQQLVHEASQMEIQRLIEFLRLRNGFFAFESALHVFPASLDSDVQSLYNWNRSELWKKHYGNLAKGILCFAEDVFGGQYCFHADRVFKFDPETGTLEDMASDLNEWAGRILSDWRTETGWPLAHEWQVRHGALAPGKRLVPRIPFVLGGAFDMANIQSMDAVRGMQVRGVLARQIHNLPDGSKIQFVISE
jgi:hypothetical protein